jgi:hypothetical protein
MDGLVLLTLILMVGSILGLVYVLYYNTFQKYLIKIQEVENRIDEALRNQYDLLGEIAIFIRENTKEEALKSLDEIEKDNISSFDLERKLVSLVKEVYEIRLQHRDLIKMENFINMDFSLKENQAKIEGYTAYYNDNISKFNHLVRIFPSNIVAKFSRFREKTFYDGKDMTDKNIDDFKL